MTGWDEFYNIDWQGALNALNSELSGKDKPGSEQALAMWDGKASAFTHKPKRSGYLSKFLQLLSPEEGDTVFDMGCGPGTLSIPLALAGHDAFAVDFSPFMLAELLIAAEESGVPVVVDPSCKPQVEDAKAQILAEAQERGEKLANGYGKAFSDAFGEDAGACSPGTIHVFKCSWQQDWKDLPKADIAISSRSLVTDEKAQGIEKLQGQARKRAVLTVGAGDIPYYDSRIASAISPDKSVRKTAELVNIVCYLLWKGRLPRLEYIVTEGRTRRKTREEIEKFVLDMSGAPDGGSQDELERFMREHVVFNEESGMYELDYARKDTWAYIEWSTNPEE